jgi:hypothetical protein
MQPLSRSMELSLSWEATSGSATEEYLSISWNLRVFCRVHNSSLLAPELSQMNHSESESESELLYDWRFTDSQFVLATSPLKLTTSNFIFQLNTCSYIPYVTSSLTRGWICRLQLLLALANAVILRSESHRTHDHILLSQIPGSPNLDGQVPVFVFPRNRVARLYPQALGSYITHHISPIWVILLLKNAVFWDV